MTDFTQDPIASNQNRVVLYTWIFLIALSVVDVFLLYYTHTRLSPDTLPFTIAVAGGIGAITLIYRYLRKDFGIYIALQMTNQLIVGSLVIAALSYLGAWFNYPFIDNKLEVFDHIPGYDWLTYAKWVNSNPLRANIFFFCYRSAGPGIPLVPVVLFLLKEFVPLQRFALGFLVSATFTIVLATFWPARIAFEYYGITANMLPHVDVAGGLHYLYDYYAMRNHTMNILPFAFAGLVEFPSFHSTIAILGIAAANHIRLKPLRYLVILINAIMLISTPVNGGHYFIDTVAGAIIGIITVILMNRIIPFEKTAKNAKEILSSVKEPA